MKYASKLPPAVPLNNRPAELPSTKSNVLPANSKEEPIALTLVFTFRILPVMLALELISPLAVMCPLALTLILDTSIPVLVVSNFYYLRDIIQH